jgi:hypothetical protein
MRRCAQWLTGLTTLLAAGCGESASVRLTLEAPTAEELSPLDGRVANLTLMVTGEGLETQIQTRAVADRMEELSLGEVPIAPALQLTLIASDLAGRLVGFGRGEGPVDVALGDDVEVAIRMRKPFAYATGGPALLAFDTTLDATQSYLSTVQALNPDAVAVTPDGADVAIVALGTILLYSTATHTVRDGAETADVSPDARDAMVSADGRHVVVVHATGLDVFDTDDLRSGPASARQVDLVNPAVAVAMGSVAWVLLDATDGSTCGTSSLAAVDLESGEVLKMVSLGHAAADLALDVASGTTLVALPCEDKVVTVPDPDDEFSQRVFLELESPTAIAASGGRLYAVGHIDAAEQARLVIAQKALDGSGESQRQLQVPVERLEVTDPVVAGPPGQAAEASLNADAVLAYDLAVLPDGSRIGLLARFEFEGEPVGDVFGSPVFPGILLTTYEYQLLDAVSGTPLERARTYCEHDEIGPSFLQDFECTAAPGQNVIVGAGNTEINFVPRDLAVLYGDR